MDRNLHPRDRNERLPSYSPGVSTRRKKLTATQTNACKAAGGCIAYLITNNCIKTMIPIEFGFALAAGNIAVRSLVC